MNKRIIRPIIRNKFRKTREEKKSFWNITPLTALTLFKYNNK